jgi:hypothetical protein
MYNEPINEYQEDSHDTFFCEKDALATTSINAIKRIFFIRCRFRANIKRTEEV